VVGYSYGLGDGVYFDWNDPVNGALPLRGRAAGLRPEPASPSQQSSIPNAGECKHETQIKSCGMKVCFDCGAPMNVKAKQIAAMRGAS